MGQLTPTEGSIRVGANVNIGYYAQNQEDLMNGDFTVYDTLDRVAVGDVRTRLRDILGAFLFRGEDIDKKVKVLSGGERARLAMARLMLEPYNLLILDEPTNHMDMRSKRYSQERHHEIRRYGDRRLPTTASSRRHVPRFTNSGTAAYANTSAASTTSSKTQTGILAGGGA